MTDLNSNLYAKLDPVFYDESSNSLNPFTRSYHGGRYVWIREKIREIHHSFSSPAPLRILDVGGGSSAWNKEHLPVIAIDMNQKMLEYAKKCGRVTEFIIKNLNKTPWPMTEKSFDVVVVSEVLEHLDAHDSVLFEISRILKDDGSLLLTVPLDKQFSLWRTLFGVECFVVGDVLGNDYYRKRCGHIQNFSSEQILVLLKRFGFTLIRMENTLMNVRVMAKKSRG